jgi:hypothetical protein
MINVAQVDVQVVAVAVAVAASAESPAGGDVWRICQSDSVGCLRT